MLFCSSHIKVKIREARAGVKGEMRRGASFREFHNDDRETMLLLTLREFG
jgi:hypothetical protein